MFAAEHLSYGETGAFTKIVSAYLGASDALKPFYHHPPTLEGIRQTIEEKRQQPQHRELLVSVLKEQYASVKSQQPVNNNIDLLAAPATFTICTAHQPNLFTGPLYFVYKILHTIRLAQRLKKQLPDNHFVPVYYMGSEDADFAELNHTYVEGKKLEWKREQKGAVGRMTADHTLLALIEELDGQLTPLPYGHEVTDFLRNAYAKGKTIQQATFELIHQLYGDKGLVVLIPDHPKLKAVMNPVFETDLFGHRSSAIVADTSERLEKYFDVQAHPREINLFYLKENIRERIIRKGEWFTVHNTDIRFNETDMRRELQHHPERFSPNVILRGLFQETILPNIVFIGGGGEMAYWLQLKDLFRYFDVVYPVLVLRNSFLVIEAKWQEKIKKLGLSVPELFQPEGELMKRIVEKNSDHEVHLNGNMEKAEALFEELKLQAGTIDPTLSQHVAAIRARSIKSLQELEKKMLRAEKRRFSDQQYQLSKIKEALFPRNGLQERVENFSSFYARWGKDFIDALLEHSPALEQQFTVLIEESPVH